MKLAASLCCLTLVLFQVVPAHARPRLALVRCPAFIGNPKTKQYMKIDSGLVCSNASLKKGGLKQGDVIVKGKHTFETSFEYSGQGQANTPAFQVGKKPAVITYSFPDPSGKASFRISVVDITTGKVVTQLINTRGNVDSGSTYFHTSGAFYLRIDAEPSVHLCTSDETGKYCEDDPLQWDVSLEFAETCDDPDFCF